MSLTRRTDPDQHVKVEDPVYEENIRDLTNSTMNPPRKHAREGSITGATAPEAVTLSGQVKDEEVTGPSSIRDPRSPLTPPTPRGLRTTRRELHSLRSFMEFAGKKLHDQAMRRFRGIDSDTASEGDLEDSKSDDEV
ncbi:hypothetical protein B0H13DRAFT_2302660 [Mycena leptocephala]|nr:hypothetical protein B0H13DRAFT_2302660 [Mycena leptocephala]